MAIVVRYFSTSAAGSEDGTSWADRAALISGGVYSSIITSFDFGGTDSLECRIGPGDYTMPSDLTSARFSVAAPTVKNVLMLQGCDSSGEVFIPDYNWNCCQGDLVTTNYPNFITQTFIIQLNYLFLRCITVISAKAGTLANLANGNVWEHCLFRNTQNSTSAIAIGIIALSDSLPGYIIKCCQMECTGTSYDAVISSNVVLGLHTVRVKGNINATSGNRQGMKSSAAGGTGNRGPMCILDNVNEGIIFANSGARISNTTINNCGTAISGTTNINASCLFINNYIANCTNGIVTSTTMSYAINNRIRVSGTALNLPTNNISINNDVSSGSDNEYKNPSAGDFRISKDSMFWGKNVGGGDENFHAVKLISRK